MSCETKILLALLAGAATGGVFVVFCLWFLVYVWPSATSMCSL